MDLFDYLSAFRRRWLVIVVTVVVAIAVAWFTTETFAPVTSSESPTYRATTLLSATGASIGDLPGAPSALALYVTLPQVARRAAKELGFKGDPLVLRRKVQASPDAELPFLRITSVAPKQARAEKVADAFAVALIEFLRDRRRSHLGSQTATFDQDIQSAKDAGNVDAATSLQAQLGILRSQASSPLGVTVIQKAIAQRITSTSFQPPDSVLVRLLIALVIGLLAGAGLALVLERIDRKIRTSGQATERFGHPVLAEIPTIPKKQRKGVVTADHPTSRIADAFRLLGAGVHVAVRPGPEEGSPSRGRIVLVTSSGPSEGKSTVVANLAAGLAEEGRKVIVFSADLRRPTLHEVLGADRQPGLVQAARETETGPYHPNGNSGIRRYKQTTRLAHVLFVPSGGAAERPGEVLASQGVVDLLREARTAADWVIVDTAPILVAGESAPMIDEADLVLVVARSGSTPNSVAERTRDTLHRLGANSVWVVLNGIRESGVPAAYRRYQASPERDAIARASLTKGFPG